MFDNIHKDIKYFFFILKEFYLKNRVKTQNV